MKLRVRKKGVNSDRTARRPCLARGHCKAQGMLLKSRKGPDGHVRDGRRLVDERERLAEESYRGTTLATPVFGS
jgi:hypothetical protein